MNSAEFVAGLRQIAERDAVEGVIATLLQPPGRTPATQLVRLANWFASLDEQERQRVEEVAMLGASQALYNVLLVLDGTMPLPVNGRIEQFEIYAGGEQSRVLLNDARTDSLADIYKSLDEGGP